jgi:hypothetical protein
MSLRVPLSSSSHYARLYTQWWRRLAQSSAPNTLIFQSLASPLILWGRSARFWTISLEAHVPHGLIPHPSPDCFNDLEGSKIPPRLRTVLKALGARVHGAVHAGTTRPRRFFSYSNSIATVISPCYQPSDPANLKHPRSMTRALGGGRVMPLSFCSAEFFSLYFNLPRNFRWLNVSTEPRGGGRSSDKLASRGKYRNFIFTSADSH